MIHPVYALNRSEMYRIFFSASLVFVKEQLLPIMVPERVEDTLEYLCILSASMHTAIYEKHVEKESISLAYIQEYVRLIDTVFSHHSIITYGKILQISKLYSKAIELVKIVSESPNCEQLLIKLHGSYYHWSVNHKMLFAKVGVIH